MGCLWGCNLAQRKIYTIDLLLFFMKPFVDHKCPNKQQFASCCSCHFIRILSILCVTALWNTSLCYLYVFYIDKRLTWLKENQCLLRSRKISFHWGSCLRFKCDKCILYLHQGHALHVFTPWQTGLIENSNALVTLGVKRSFFLPLAAKIGDYFSIYQVSDAWYCLFNLKVFAIVVR